MIRDAGQEEQPSCCSLLASLCALDIVTVNTSWASWRHRSPFTPQLCYLRRQHWGVEDTSSETLVFIPQVAGPQKWTNARSLMASFSLQCSGIRTRCPDFHPSCNVTLCWHPQAVIFLENILQNTVCTYNGVNSRRFCLTPCDWWRWLTEASGCQSLSYYRLSGRPCCNSLWQCSEHFKSISIQGQVRKVWSPVKRRLS